MRIFVASGIWYPDAGGPATHLAAVIPWLRARQHEVRGLAYGSDGTHDPAEALTRIALGGPVPLREARYARAYRCGAGWADVVYVASLGLPRWIEPRRPVVLRVPGDRAWERAVNRGLVPDDEDLDRFQSRRHGPRVAYLKWARAREARSADHVVTPSRYVRDVVVGWGTDEGRVSVIPSAVPPDVPSLDREEARRELGWESEGCYLVAAARLTAWKGIDLLIAALTVRPGVRLIVAGDGPQREALASLAASRQVDATFVGSLSRPALARYLAASDYAVVYSSYEGLSHTILEAFHQGTPVIASARGGNPEAVRHGINGLLVRHPDVDALASALGVAFEGTTRARLAAGARATANAGAWVSSMDAVAQVIESAGRGRPSEL